MQRIEVNPRPDEPDGAMSEAIVSRTGNANNGGRLESAALQVRGAASSKVSITLPSLFPQALLKALQNIRTSTYGAYEIIVVSPFQVSGPDIVWIQETQQRGCAYAHTRAAEIASGDFLVAFADDHRFVDGWDMTASRDLIALEAREQVDICAIGLQFINWNFLGTVFGKYYPNFPFMRRSVVRRVGWIGEDYQQGFGDCDLGMRIWDAGGFCECSSRPLIAIHQDDKLRPKPKASDADILLFASRWAPKYGTGWNTGELSGFNIDVELEMPRNWRGSSTPRSWRGSSTPRSWHGSSTPQSRAHDADLSLPTRLASHDSDTRLINVAIGNHAFDHGIGEILYTLKALFSRLSSSYEVTYSIDLKPGVTNVLIDEFSLGKTIAFLQEFKRDHPGTKFVIVGTEFITPIRLFGRQIGETFNYFDRWEDRKYGFAMISHRFGLTRVPPYMRARYLGFSQALRLADLVIAVHPAITEALLPLTAKMDHWVASPVTLYPEINAEKNVLNVRLEEWPVGFVTTGRQTRFRREIVRKLLLAATNIGVQGPVFAHLPFEQTAPFALHDGAIEFPFETLGSQISEEKRLDIVGPERGGLFNLNPPQRANWQYSSPMRILRAILYGQIPIITRRFGDHEIEALAKLWDPDISDSPAIIRDLWLEATLERESLIERHIAAISQYNRVAEQKNAAVDLAFQAL